MSKLMSFLYEVWQILLVFIIISVLLVITQRMQIYHPRSYNQADKKLIPYTNKIPYEVAGLKQTAFLFPPNRAAKKVWILLGGNASLALQWLLLLQHMDLTDTSFLLVDYPGYGLNKGYPSEPNNTLAVTQAYKALKKQLSTDPKLFLMGHSLGAAVAINAAQLLHPNALVLLSPFTSIYAMAKRSLSPPWAWLLKEFIWDTYQSKQHLTALATNHPSMQVYILHGNDDTIVPARMGKELADINTNWHYQQLANKQHQLPFEAKQTIIELIKTVENNN